MQNADEKMYCALSACVMLTSVEGQLSKIYSE